MRKANPPKPEYENEHEAGGDEPRLWKRIKLGLTTDRILAITTISIALIGMWQACLTRQSLKDQNEFSERQRIKDSIQLAMSRQSANDQSQFSRATLDSTGVQLGIAHKAMIEQLRPYISIEVEGDSDIGKSWNAPTVATRLVVTNHGQTPAEKVTCWTDIRCLSLKFPESDSLGKNSRLFGGPISPGAGLRLPVADAISPEQIDSIKRKLAKLYVWGKIEFTDVFGLQHGRRFRFVATGDKPGTFPDKWEVCKGGNGEY